MQFKPTHRVRFTCHHVPPLMDGVSFNIGDTVDVVVTGEGSWFHEGSGYTIPDYAVEVDAVLSTEEERLHEPGLRIAPSGQIETGVKDTNPKDAVGSRKLPWHVIPWRVMPGVVLAFFGGALKYRAFNYRIAGVRATVYVDGILRHLTRFIEGEDYDPDVKGYNHEDPSKGVLIHHLDELIAGAMVLRDSILAGNWTDDRAPAVKPGWIDEANEMAARIIDANPEPNSNWTEAEVRKARAVAAAVEAFDKNTGAHPAPSAPAAFAPAAADTPAPIPPSPFMAIHDTGPGDFTAEIALGLVDPPAPVVSEGMVAVLDKDGRATGALIPAGVYWDKSTFTFRKAEGDSVDDRGGAEDSLFFYSLWVGRSGEFPLYEGAK